MGQIVTFYSYKGGVGRSMALANVGHILAWQLKPQRKVLMIDWDLEAPGLHKFFADLLESESGEGGYFRSNHIQRAPGLIDFLHEIYTFYSHEYPEGNLAVMYADTDGARTAFAKAVSRHPLRDFILRVSPPSYETSGQLFLMKAGSEISADFVHKVRTFPWQSFFDRFGSFFTLFCEYLVEKYDTVLIDSRTGLTDIGDICTRVMPDKLVGVFTPNEQSIEGLVGVLKRSAEHRKNSRDPRDMSIFPLASRIDASRGQLRRVWWKGGIHRNRVVRGYELEFERLIAGIYELDECDLDAFFDSTQVPHDADYAFGEEVAARDPSSGRLGISYSCGNLARYLAENHVPWERLPSEPLPAQLPTVPRASLRDLLRAMTQGVSVFLALLIAGLVLASIASAPNPAEPVYKNVWQYTVKISSTSAVGLGMGFIKISIVAQSSDQTPRPPQAPLRLTVTRGSIDRQTISSSNDTAVLRSTGIGSATLTLTATGALLDSRLSPEQVSISLDYTWPITAVTGAIL
jgi:hypothetical protein